MESDMHTSKEKDKGEEDEIFAQIKADINEIIGRHNFKEPYSIKVVEELPRNLAVSQLENGSQIQSPWPYEPGKPFRRGTLGAFLSDGDILYGITCAHVVNHPEEDHAVYIHRSGPQYQVFAVSNPQRTLNFGSHQHFALIDFAAIQVLDEMRANCERCLKDEEGLSWNWIITNISSNDLVGNLVYKYGGQTGMTKGIVSTADFSVASNSEHYLIMIEVLPGSDDHMVFSHRGDSGSVVCKGRTPDNGSTFDPSEPRLMAVSMIHAGDMKYEGQTLKHTLSFYLPTAIEKLLDGSNINLQVPQE